MQNWESNNLLFLQSAPVKVRFAGWESTTHQLQVSGWQLSIREHLDLYMRPDLSIQLAMKHEQARLFALARPLSIDMGEIHEALHLGRFDSFINFMKDKVFEVFCVSPTIEERYIIEGKAPIEPPKFMPIDAAPQYEKINMGNFSLEDLAIFRPINPDSEIVVHPEIIPKLMEDIRKAQAPKQKEIREKLRKQALREKGNEMNGYNPAKDIKAQIVVVSG